MRILVTGSSGYIAPHLITALRGQGHFVVGVDRADSDTSEPDIFVEGELTKLETMEQALGHGIDLIAHLAAARADWGLSDDEYFRDNVTATERVIQAGHSAGVKDWVYFSTVGVFGSSSVPLDDTAPLAPVGAYGTTKARAEELFDEMGVSAPTNRTLVIRPSAVYGPGNPANTNIYRLIDAIHRRRFVMIGDGSNTKTVSYLPNLIQATVFLMERMAPGVRKYIYVDSPTMKTSELVARIYSALGRRPPRWKVPLPLASVLAHPADFAARVLGSDLPITSARIQKFCLDTNFDRTALDQTGFVPEHSPDDAIDATVEWYLETQAISRNRTPRVVIADA